MLESHAVTSSSPRVALLGAHTALAENTVEAAEDLDLDLRWVQATTSAHVGPGMILIDPAVLGDHDLFVVAFDDPIVPAILRGLENHGASVIDLSGHSADLDVPPAFAGLGPAPTWPAWARVETGPAHPVLSVVAALAPLGARAADVVTWESAASRDRDGIETLSEETRAVFTLQDKAPSAFPGTLAFNVLGAGAEAEAALKAALEASKLDVAWSVTRLMGPSFSVETAVLRVELAEPAGLEAVKDHLEAGRALRVVDGPFSAYDAAGRDDVRISGLRADGRHLRLVLSYDRLRRGAAIQAAWLLQSWRDAR